MTRTSFAFFVALIIHILFLLIVWIALEALPKEPHKEIKKDENKIKISLKEMPIKKKKSGITEEKTIKQPIAPPMPKGSQLKKIITKPPIKYEPKKVSKPKIIPKKELVKKVVPLKPKALQKPFIALEKKRDPMAWMYEDKSTQTDLEQKTKIDSQNAINQNIKELYGSDFGSLTQGQQQYILDNQEIMRRITQEVLTRVASVNLTQNLNVNRSNIIEFYLHPNGDMSDFRFIQNSGIYILDDTTRETIEYAYSRYPRPKEKTLIRYNVFYNLLRY